jgi:hypothetical protein
MLKTLSPADRIGRRRGDCVGTAAQLRDENAAALKNVFGDFVKPGLGFFEFRRQLEYKAETGQGLNE